jgi:predicted transcriptional regulator
MPRGKLESGWAKARLVRELAANEKSQVTLAQEYGVTQGAISQFSARHSDEIEATRNNLADEWFGLWVTDKRNRVAEYQDDIEKINEVLANEPDDKLLKTKLSILRQVAEELGQLKETVELTGKLTYVVEGVDLTRLQ